MKFASNNGLITENIIETHTGKLWYKVNDDNNEQSKGATFD